VFHYVPLHSSPAGRRFGRAIGDLRITTSVAERLVRLPLWVGMTDADIERVVAAIHAALSARRSAVHAT
jgi:dTDP-4-amino-4,6-dideoxygalactose transaminase